MRAFHFYIDDWLSSKTIHRMDAYEERGYLRLLLYAASEPDCGLPDDDQELADISLLGQQWFEPTKEPAKRFRNKTSGEKLRENFFSKAGRLFNARLLREFEYQKEVAEKRQAAGRASAESRRKSREANEHVFNTCSTHAEHPDEQRGEQKRNNDVCVSVTSSSTGSCLNKQTPTESPELAETFGRVSNNINQRHPAKRRDLTPWQIEANLRLILTCHRIRADPEKVLYLRALDQRHNRLCESDEWKENGGRYAKSLRNWLKPEDGLYDIEPDKPAPGEQELSLDQKAALQRYSHSGDPDAEYQEFMARVRQQRVS